MSDSHKEQIQQTMLAKDTDELLAIWRENDRGTWSDEAFEVIRDILVDRISDLPAQSKPDNSDVNGDELLDSEPDEDTYYNFNRLTRIASWASVLSWFFLGVGVLFIFSVLFGVFSAVLQSGTHGLQIVFSLVSTLLWGLISIFFFVMSQAIAEGVYLIMDIEANTRRDIKR